MTPADPDGIDVEPAGGDELTVATAFAARRSRRPALQETKGGAQPNRTRKQPPNVAGLSLLLTHPIILRDLPPHADARPSQSELTRLHRTLSTSTGPPFAISSFITFRPFSSLPRSVTTTLG